MTVILNFSIFSLTFETTESAAGTALSISKKKVWSDRTRMDINLMVWTIFFSPTVFQYVRPSLLSSIKVKANERTKQKWIISGLASLLGQFPNKINVCDICQKNENRKKHWISNHEIFFYSKKKMASQAYDEPNMIGFFLHLDSFSDSMMMMMFL